MIYQEYQIPSEDKTSNATLTTYLLSHYDEMGLKERPLIIICPGGGYSFLSNREAEMFALQWAS